MPASDTSGTGSDRGSGTTRGIAAHLMNTARFGEAIGLFGQLLLTDPEDADALSEYLKCARMTAVDPLEGLEKLLYRRPESIQIRTELIRLYQRRGRYGQVREVATSGPGEPLSDWLLHAGDAAQRTGDLTDAEDLYRRVMDRDPANNRATAGLAKLVSRGRDYQGALGLLDADGVGPAIDLNQVYMRLSANRRLGRTADAAQAASDGLGALLDNKDRHAAARLLDRLGFNRPAAAMRDQISADGTRQEMARVAAQQLGDGEVSDAVVRYRALGGRKWQARVNPRNSVLLQRTIDAFCGGEPDPEWRAIERRRISLPASAFDSLLDRVLQLSPHVANPGHVMMVSGGLGAGGAERQLVLTAKGIADLSGRHVEVATLRPMGGTTDDHLLPDLVSAGIRHHDLGGDVGAWRSGLPLRAAHAEPLVRLLPENVRTQLRALCHQMVLSRPEVVHGWQDVTGAVAAIAGLLVGTPRILIGTRSLAPDRKEGRNRPWLRHVLQRLLQSPRVHLVNNSHSGVLDYGRWLTRPSLSITLIHNGFDLSSFSTAPLSERTGDTVTIGGVMRLTEEKRPDLWVDTLGDLVGRGLPVRGLLVGDGPLMGQVRERAEALGLSDRLQITGRRTDMIKQYQCMDLLLLTSRTEGLPNVLVEAQACGRPVVSTDAGGASETFVDGESGRLCRDDAVSALADVVAEMIVSAERRVHMGQRAAAHVRAEFDLGTMIKRTCQVYGWEKANDGEQTGRT